LEFSACNCLCMSLSHIVTPNRFNHKESCRICAPPPPPPPHCKICINKCIHLMSPSIAHAALTNAARASDGGGGEAAVAGGGGSDARMEANSVVRFIIFEISAGD
jgi:hypothetical protein